MVKLLMFKALPIGIIIILVIAFSGCLSYSNHNTSINTLTPEQQANLTRILGTWHGSNNLTYTFGNIPEETGANGNVTVVDEASAYDNEISRGAGSWYLINDHYVIDINTFSLNEGINNSSWYDEESKKLVYTVNAVFIRNESGRQYFYDYRNPSIKYYKIK